MLKNYLKVAVRNLFKHKSYALINILGLAVGIAASVLIFIYITYETSYDTFHEKADRTYRITADWSNQGDSRIHQLGTPYILAKTIRENYPQVEAVTQLSGPLGDVILKYEDTAFKETEVFCAEPSFFDVFSFRLLDGNPATCLRDPDMMVITQTLAKRYFGEEDPLGKTIEMQAFGQKEFFQISGIMQDIPLNSHFRFDLLISMKTIFPEPNMGWTWNNYVTYLALRDGVTQALMEEKLVEIDKVYFRGGE